MPDFLSVAAIGVLATLMTDAWAVLARRLFGQPLPDYALVGRWVGHMGGGRFAHAQITAAPAVGGERVLGWLVHYATGVFFAAVFLSVLGPGWLARPTPAPALVFGLATVAAPFLIMQPAFGLGVAGSRSKDPRAARLRSLGNHLAFGAGLYLAAVIVGFGF